MSDNKKDLIKLLNFTIEISAMPNNTWFKNALIEKLVEKNNTRVSSNTEISDIHEYCIKQILKEQAKMFYKDFKLLDINETLCNDFVRMEQFRREDSFQDFSLAMFQQFELIINTLCTQELENYIKDNLNEYVNGWTDKVKGIQKGKKLLWQYLSYFSLEKVDVELKLSKPILNWDFNEKYRACLVYYYFNNAIRIENDFFQIAKSIHELYQIRNLNHRGGKKTDKQFEIVRKISDSKAKYYFKFLGLLEDFVTKVNLSIN